MHETYCVLIDFFIALRQNFLESPIIIAKWGGNYFFLKKARFQKVFISRTWKKEEIF
jgi:hypothetical protein